MSTQTGPLAIQPKQLPLKRPQHAQPPPKQQQQLHHQQQHCEHFSPRCGWQQQGAGLLLPNGMPIPPFGPLPAVGLPPGVFCGPAPQWRPAFGAAGPPAWL
jgi:hypothetical protein